ncbi:MAG: site-specific DNA-methyltransferase [Candidatus Sericytochromatia bacterium]|nr:site-specific DNA-methyltransferase [Candidatus Sericytochromatia bacterium]
MSAEADARANLVCHGDNLRALASLQTTHAARFRLIYLDPPYNTGRRLDHYEDDRAHADWLQMMRERLVLMAPLLRPDGVVVAQTDRHESAYLKVLLDEVFGRRSYVTTIAARMSATSGYKLEHAERTLVKNVEFLHVHARKLRLHGAAYEEQREWDNHYAYLLAEDRKTFRRLVEDARVTAWLQAQGLPVRQASVPTLHARCAEFQCWVLTAADLICRSHTAPVPARTSWRDGHLLAGEMPGSRVVEERTWQGQRYFLRRTSTGIDQLIPLSLKVRPVETLGGDDREALTNLLGDWWDGFHLDMGNVRLEGGVSFSRGKKPERLLRRLIRIFTQPDDWVLDPFAGSGTTAAVAHKMRRHWVAIESGPQALTHVVPRLDRVVSGQDPNGITRAEDWNGGGAYVYRRI